MINRQQIETKLADGLDLIQNSELRRRVVDAWMLAIQKGGWRSVVELDEMPFSLLVDCRGISFIEHTLAVTLGAVALAKTQRFSCKNLPYNFDMDRLTAGGLLHDVGKLLEIESDGKGGHRMSRNGMCARHPISGAIIAAEVGLPDEIINTIACHAKEGEGRPKVVETILIHQADFATFDPLVLMDKGSLIE